MGLDIIVVEPETLLYSVQRRVALVARETVSKIVVTDFAIEIRPNERGSFSSQFHVGHKAEINIATRISANSFHEKAGRSQDSFFFSYRWILTFSPSRLCRHPSIRGLC